MKQELEALQQKIEKQQLQEYDQYEGTEHLYFDKIYFTEIQGLYSIHYNGKGSDWAYHEELEEEEIDDLIDENEYEYTAFGELLQLCIDYSDKIGSLVFTGPDEGSNGLIEWDFSRLSTASVSFINLHQFRVQLSDMGDHNVNFIGDDELPMPEMVSQVLAKMPNLVTLELPSVPDETFFQLSYPKLRSVRLQAGYDHANFIKNLAQSELLGQISLDFTDTFFDRDSAPLSEDEKRMIEFQEKKKADIEAQMMTGLTQKEARREVERKILREAGYSEEEISLDLDNPNRAETLRLLKVIYKDEQEVNDAMNYFESLIRWDENGEAYVEDEMEEEEVSSTGYKKTPFEDFMTLFKAVGQEKRFHFRLREGYLTPEERFQLQEANKEIPFLHIPTTMGNYVSHEIETTDD